MNEKRRSECIERAFGVAASQNYGVQVWVSLQ